MKHTQTNNLNSRLVKIGDYDYLDINLIKYILNDSDYSDRVKIYFGPDSNPDNNWIRMSKTEFKIYLQPLLDKQND